MKVPKAEAGLLAAIFFDLVGFGMVIADFQLRAEALVPRGWATGPLIGVLLASTFILQLLISPWWGRRSDHLGRKPILLACTAFSILAMLAYGRADSLAWLLASRLLAGFGAANVAVAQALIADLTEGTARTAALGRMAAAISTGLILGAPLGGELARIGGNGAVGYVGAAISTIGLALLAITLPNAAPKGTANTGRRPAIDLSLLRDLPALRPLVLIAAVAWFSLATLEGTFARLIRQLFGFDQAIFGRIFGYESLLGFLVSAYLLGWISRRVKDDRLLRVSYVAQGVGLALNPLAAVAQPAIAPLVTLFGASTLYAVGAGVANPTVNGLCSRLTPDDRQGELFGLLQGARAVGFVLGPILGGWLFDWNPTSPYLIAGAVCVLAAALVPKVTP